MQTLSGFRAMQTNPITKFAKAYPEFVTTPLELELVTNLFRNESRGHQRIHETKMLKKMSELDQDCATIKGRLDRILDGTIEEGIYAFKQEDGVLPGPTDLAAASHQASGEVESFSEERAPLYREEQLNEEQVKLLVRRWFQLDEERRRGRIALAGRWSEM